MDQRPKMYRSMYQQDGQPSAGSGPFQLGVVLPPDANADITPEGGYVIVKSGGMSVFAALNKIPARLIPTRLREQYPNHFQRARGDDNLCIWCLGDGEFQDASLTGRLVLRLDKLGEKRHGLIEPNVRMKTEEYQEGLSSTIQDWNICEEPR